MPLITAAVERPTAPVGVGRHLVAGEAARYFAASLAALLIDAGLLFIGVQGFGLPVWLAGALAYGAGLVLIYQLSIRWVFADRALHDGRSEFVVFAILGIFGLVLNSATLFVATSLGLALPFAKIVSAAIGFVANFASRKCLLFSARKP
jgi:putative flippase GtrA